MLNQKRDSLAQIETRYGLRVIIGRDDALIPPNFRLERLRAYAAGEAPHLNFTAAPPPAIEEEDEVEVETEAEAEVEGEAEAEAAPRRRRPQRAANGDARPAEREPEGDEERGPRRRRRRRRRSDDGREERRAPPAAAVGEAGEMGAEGAHPAGDAGEQESEGERRRRRRGRRGGRWRERNGAGGEPTAAGAEAMVQAAVESAPVPLPDVSPMEEGSMQAGSVQEGSMQEGPMEEGSMGYRHEPVYAELARPEPDAVEIDKPVVETVVEAAIESSAIPPVEIEPVPEPMPIAAAGGNGASAEVERKPEPEPAGPPPTVDVHAVTEKPASPRRGWWNRLIQS
jgi:ribonuclease E